MVQAAYKGSWDGWKQVGDDDEGGIKNAYLFDLRFTENWNTVPLTLSQN